MSKIHICNTFFESEVMGISTRPLRKWMLSHPVIMQLQFLPLLYAKKEDLILVSSVPIDSDPRLISFDDPAPKTFQIEDWGASLAIQKWADVHGIPYQITDWNLIETINSKFFSFTHSPKLKGAEVLNNEKEIQTWLNKMKGPKVLKSFYETAGRGHLINPENPKRLKGPLIGEPWVERSLDFSTQWKNKQLLGVTVFDTNQKGTHERTFIEEIPKWALEEHLHYALPLVEKIHDLGYDGNLGIDAFIYLENHKEKLHPIVEINPRKTMSWVALQRPEKKLIYSKKNEGLLPSHLGKVRFPRNLTCT